MSNETTIDLVTYNQKNDSYTLVLVEEGPWFYEKIKENLKRLQDKLYNCVNIVIDGILTTKYPDSKGKDIIIQLDCYDTPQKEVADFFARFSLYINDSKEVQSAISNKGFAKSLQFKYRWNTLKK